MRVCGRIARVSVRELEPDCYDGIRPRKRKKRRMRESPLSQQADPLAHPIAKQRDQSGADAQEAFTFSLSLARFSTMPRLSCSLFGILRQTSLLWCFNKQGKRKEKGKPGNQTGNLTFFVSQHYFSFRCFSLSPNLIYPRSLFHDLIVLNLNAIRVR